MTTNVELKQRYVNGERSIAVPPVLYEIIAYLNKGPVDACSRMTKTLGGRWFSRMPIAQHSRVKRHDSDADRAPKPMNDLDLNDYRRLYRAFERKQRPWLAD